MQDGLLEGALHRDVGLPGDGFRPRSSDDDRKVGAAGAALVGDVERLTRRIGLHRREGRRARRRQAREADIGVADPDDVVRVRHRGAGEGHHPKKRAHRILIGAPHQAPAERSAIPALRRRDRGR